MTVDLERLIVSMSADFKSYENALAKASGVTREQLKQIRADAAQTGGAAAVAFEGATRGMQRFGGQALAVSRQTRQLNADTTNLVAQFQDIGVQLASGTSPLLIAVQQGTQISNVLGGQGARGAVAALASAFGALVSPVSLVTIGLIAAGSAAVQYFSSLQDEGPKSAEQLKQQADLIKRVGEEWGAAVPSLREYAAELERLASIESLREASEAAVGDIWAEPKRQVQEYAEQVAIVETVLQSIGDTDALQRLRDAFQNLQDKVEDETASGEDAVAVQDALNQMLITGGPVAEALAASMGVLAGSLDSAAASAARVTSEVAGAISAMQQFRAAEQASMAALRDTERATGEFVRNQERRNALSEEELRLENEKVRVQENAERAGGLLSDQTALDLAKQTLAAEERRAQIARETAAAARKSGGGGRGGGGSKAKEIDREREAVTKLIEALQFEQSLIGLTELEKEKANALRRAGAAATAEERAQIEALITATYNEKAAIEANEEALRDLKVLSKDVLGGIFEDLRDGASAAEILANALNRVAESLIRAGIDQLIEGAFTGGGRGGGLFGGRIIPGILHEGGVAGVDGYGHGRAVPAAVFANARRYHNGGTILPNEVPAILQRGETVLPRGASGAASRVHLTVGVDVNKSGNLLPFVSSVSEAVAGRVVKRTAPGVVLDAQRRGA